VLHRAYSLLELKSVDEDQRLIIGVATTPEPDRMGDIVEPKGAQFKLPIPLLIHHDTKQPIGEVFKATVTDEGIEIQARIAKIEEPGKLKDRVDEAWQSIKAKLIRGFSIGFKEIEAARIKDTFSYRFTKWLWLETSAVTIPANAGATIQAIKSYDIGRPAQVVADPTRPGASGTSRVVKARPDTPMKKTIADQIKEFEATRASKVARMDALLEKSGEDGVTLAAEEQTEHDELDRDVKEIDAHLVRLRAAQSRQASAATVVKGDNADDGSRSRAGLQIQVRDQTPPGIKFARLAKVMALSKGSMSDALTIAAQLYPNDTRLVEVVKAAVGAATTANHQGPDLQYTDYFGDFVEYLRPMTIVGKFGTNGIPALRRVPFNIRVGTQTAGGSGYWVGQGLPIPLSKGTYGTITLDFTKVAAIQVATKEELRFTTPSAETKLRDDIAQSLVARIDQDFIDPANAGTANVKPASITNGIAATAVSGTNAAAFSVDFKGLMSGPIAANITPSTGVFIMSATQALSMSLMLNALGQPQYPGLTINGGTLMGFPVIVSEYMTSFGSPSTQMIVFVNASDVYLADDGDVAVEASDQVSLEMLDGSLTQNATTGTGASLVSMWQTECLALKGVRPINWKLRRAAAVAYLSPTAYA